MRSSIGEVMLSSPSQLNMKIQNDAFVNCVGSLMNKFLQPQTLLQRQLATPPQPAQVQDVQVCKEYMQNGHCRNKRTCTLLHPLFFIQSDIWDIIYMLHHLIIQRLLPTCSTLFLPC